MAEFAANNNELASIKLSPFFASRGFYLQMSFNIVELSDIIILKQINRQKALDISKAIQTTWKFERESLTKAQISQSIQADKH